jgi:ATP-dependent DNA ligase
MVETKTAMVHKMITRLYKITATGTTQIWEVRQLPHSNQLHLVWGQLHGAIQQQIVLVTTNSSGRTMAEQCCLEADSRINKQLDKGYCRTLEEAKQSIGLNAAKLYKPMLAQKFQDVNVDFKKCFIQRKYNGHRCLMTATEDGIVAYSRNGKPIPGVEHITNVIKLKPGQTIDGELYIHGEALQDIGSLIRKKQANSKQLQYIVYDTIVDMPYKSRLDILLDINGGPDVIIAPTYWQVNDLQEELSNAIDDGYEGVMLRTNDKGYEPGKRSKQLIKVKKADDCEVLIIGVTESHDGWAIFECMTLYTNKVFRVSAPGTIKEKTHALEQPYFWIGNLLTIQHFGFTNNGVPFHPVAIGLRDNL